MGAKEELIIRFLSTIESATFKEIVANIPLVHHYNSKKSIADTLGILIRKDKVFRIDRFRYRLKKESDNINQESLF